MGLKKDKQNAALSGCLLCRRKRLGERVGVRE